MPLADSRQGAAPLTDTTSRAARMRIAVLVVAVAAAMAYAGTLTFDFVWDDTLLIQRSHQLHYWRDLLPALSTHFWAEVQESSHYYRPLVTLSFFLDLSVWGLNPLGFHLTNLLAHLGASLAVLALAHRLSGSELAAGATGLLFALHPLHTEPVAFVSGRTDVLATLFFLIAVLGYARWRDTGSRAACAGSLVSFFLALGAKEVAVTLPLVLALYDWTRSGGERRPAAAARALGRYSLYGAVLLVYVAIRAWALGGLADATEAAWAPLYVRVLTGIKIIGWYAWLVLVPYPANAYYPIVPTGWPPPPTWWLPAGVLVATLGLTTVALRFAPVVGFGALWFWITLIPSAGVNFLPLSAPIMAERFLYLPSVGFCLVAGLAIGRLLREIETGDATGPARQVRPVPAAALAALLVTYALSTLWRNESWKDDYRLYLNMVETSPEAALPHVNLAFTQLQKGEVASAREHLARAVEILPQNPRALVGLALAQTVLGEREAGLVHALKAYAYAPKNPNVLATLGAVYLYRDEPARAVVHLEDALKLNPNQPNAVLNLALAQAKLGHHAEAEQALGRGLTLSAVMTPGSAFGHRVAAEVYGDRDPARARAAWERYIAWLRSLPEPSDRQRADLAYSERQLARLAGERR